MGDRKKAGNNANKKSKTEWPSIKPNDLIVLEQVRRRARSKLTWPMIENFFTPVESKAFIKVAEAIGFLHQGSLGPTKGEAYRDNDRIAVQDPVLADAIWNSGLKTLFSDIKIRGKVAVGLNPNIRCYRYTAGQRFGRHIDESTDLGGGRRTYYTLLVYLSGTPGGTKFKSKNDNDSQDSLSETLVGGETVFYGPRNALVAEVPPAEGMALLHIHGDKCMLHEARNVVKLRLIIHILFSYDNKLEFMGKIHALVF
ncbi:2-oxoglutarate (2OG) and Fe(II)-dependent oxygenase superfamily protein [Forsythia ovata]|uniref:2-oxoglutarate (2OG) and Fe(II)-dependent oxygenase superfamily protein n=1 Tax=Forsythia ovata TaxID=205694 RepID=A0ABD1X9C1_9LAMI